MKYAGLTYREVADTLGMRSGVGASLQPRSRCRHDTASGPGGQGVEGVRPCFVLHQDAASRRAAKLIAVIKGELDGQMPEPVCE